MASDKRLRVFLLILAISVLCVAGHGEQLSASSNVARVGFLFEGNPVETKPSKHDADCLNASDCGKKSVVGVWDAGWETPFQKRKLAAPPVTGRRLTGPPAQGRRLAGSKHSGRRLAGSKHSGRRLAGSKHSGRRLAGSKHSGRKLAEVDLPHSGPGSVIAISA